MTECRFVKNTFLNELRDRHKLETGFLLHQNENMVLTDPLCSARSGRSQASSAHNMISKKEINDAARLMNKSMASEAHCHIFAAL